MQHILETKQAMMAMMAPPPPAPNKSEQGHSSLGAAGTAAAGKKTGGTLVPEGQGVQPIGASQGAPPAP